MKIISKIKLSKIMAWWKFGGWLDTESPLWFSLWYWTLYHMTHEDKFLKEITDTTKGCK